MAFVVKCKDGREAGRVLQILTTYMARSRFRLEAPPWSVPRRGGRVDVCLAGVRLKKAKPYCGNHPGPCRVDPRFERPHRTLAYLEGADWCGWNDLLNDVLDAVGHGGDAGSRSVNIRRAGWRRVVYEEREVRGHVDWKPEGDAGDYQDCRGKRPPPVDYPEGTPGLVGWKEAG